MKKTIKLTLAGSFLALALILPFITGQIPEIGSTLLPMHIPVLICGFICGWKYGLFIGLCAPLLRHLLFAMPPLPTAICMSFELATYGAITGILYQKLQKSKFKIYLCLLLSMLSGRLVWGIVSIIIYGLSGTPFTWKMFIAGALLNSIPGIVLQIITIPILIFSLKKTGALNENDQNYTKTCCSLSKDAAERYS